jgi:hypothetical protein
MSTVFDKLRLMIAQNQVDRALPLLSVELATYPELKNQLVTVSAKFNDIRKRQNIGVIDESESLKLFAQVNFSILDLIDQLQQATDTVVQETGPANPTAQITSASNRKVFISYNHKDVDVANILKEKLKAKNIDVFIDSERMLGGEDIKDFIEKCVRDTETTLSLVSKNSLLSAWVAMESNNTFYQEKTNVKKKFIACYITDDFFDRNFTDIALDYIEEQVQEIRNLITARLAKDRNIRDLQNELTRMTELRNNIDEIVRRLRESLCIDIRMENLENNFIKIVEAITS